MRQTLFIAAASATAFFVLGCGGNNDDNGAQDSGYDETSTNDSGVDSSIDSSSDSSVDAPKDTTSDAPADGDAGPLPARTTPTNGSAIALTKDDKIAVAANRTAGTVSVFAVKLGDATTPIHKTTTLSVGAEPWSLVIGNDDDTAYVVLRKDQKVVRIKGLHGTPTVDATAATGSEPTGIAISPSGATLYVASWAEGFVNTVHTSDMSVGASIDLNAALAASGVLGTVTARPALAHPRSLVVTNNGDTNDADESIYVSEFFSQAKSTTLTDDSQFDQNRQGVIYRVKLSDASVSTIMISPVDVTGFKDSNGNDTGCFPNQLYAVALNAGRLYVTSNCESPRGPTGPILTATPPNLANFKTEVHAALFVVDTASNTEIPAQRVLLPQQFQALYDAASPAIPDDATRRIPLIANDIAFATGTNVAYVTGYGSDGVFRVQLNADGTLNRVGSTTQPFINLAPGGTAPGDGNLPIGIAMPAEPASSVAFSLVLNESSRNVSLVDLSTQIVTKTEPSDVAPPDHDPSKPGVYDKLSNKGRKLFVTGRGRWSLKGQSWNSCESCHPDALTDDVTWFFARGPRQTVSLDGVYDPTKTKRRLLNWTAIFDEVHDFEGNVRGNSGGVGALVWQVGTPISAADRLDFDGTTPTPAGQLTTTNRDDGLNGSSSALVHSPPPTTLCATSPCDSAAIDDWNAIDAFIQTVRSPRHPTTLDAASVAAGKTLFENNSCAACHGGSQWTISRVFYAPGEPTNTNLFATDYSAPTGFPIALNPPLAASGGTKKAKLRLAPFDAANDQIDCVLRDVGTFPATGTAGIAPTGVTIKEVRQNMTATAQGATGFNPPSLLNLVAGAPYFHAGNARTLEEVFDATFSKHTQSLASVFTPSATDIKNLVAYLTSIDNDTTPEPIPTSLGFNPDLCPATFP